jgi:hypothetical protein
MGTERWGSSGSAVRIHFHYIRLPLYTCLFLFGSVTCPPSVLGATVLLKPSHLNTKGFDCISEDPQLRANDNYNTLHPRVHCNVSGWGELEREE